MQGPGQQQQESTAVATELDGVLEELTVAMSSVPQQQESTAVAREVDGVLEELMIAMSIGPTYGELDSSMALTVIQCVRVEACCLLHDVRLFEQNMSKSVSFAQNTFWPGAARSQDGISLQDWVHCPTVGTTFAACTNSYCMH